MLQSKLMSDWGVGSMNTFAPRMPARLRLTGTPSALRIPVTPRNRAYLRAVRQAEVAAWNAVKPVSGITLNTEVQKVLRRDRAERKLLSGIAVVSAVALSIGLASTFRLMERWPDFVNAVKQLIM